MAKKPYLTAKQLGIFPEERKALIAFVKAPSMGRVIEVDGKLHYYDQSEVDDEFVALKNECGTAGCVAGYVFAHAKSVQKLKKLRGVKSVSSYIDAAASFSNGSIDELESPFLTALYEQGDGSITLTKAKIVVDKALKTGKVKW